MEAPRFWRNQRERYCLIGRVCPECQTKIFPPKAVCPKCSHVLLSTPRVENILKEVVPPERWNKRWNN
ncbi:MAG: zinc ribbon domain-containing protein [bacterium]|nr:zinc ribbon domain-containing protein [bacterium]